AREKIERMEEYNRSRRLLGHYRSYRLQDGLGVPLVWAVLLAAGAAFFLDRSRKHGRGYASECQKCGRAFCRLCKPPGESALLCSSCVHVYLKKDGVSIETKLQKLDDVRRRRTLEERLRLGLNGLLPGTAAFLDSRVVAAGGAPRRFVLVLLFFPP